MGLFRAVKVYRWGRGRVYVASTRLGGVLTLKFPRFRVNKLEKLARRMLYGGKR